MKKTDITMIILIASVSILVAYFVARSIMGGGETESVQVKTIEAITSQVVEPDTTVFNENSINPTVEIIIGDKSSQTGQQ